MKLENIIFAKRRSVYVVWMCANVCICMCKGLKHSTKIIFNRMAYCDRHYNRWKIEGDARKMWSGSAFSRDNTMWNEEYKSKQNENKKETL